MTQKTPRQQNRRAKQKTSSPAPELDQESSVDEPERDAAMDPPQGAAEDSPTLPLWHDIS